MNKPAEHSKNEIRTPICVIFLIITVVTLLYGRYHLPGDVEFNFLICLFTGYAFAGAIWTLRLQSKQLKIQQEDAKISQDQSDRMLRASSASIVTEYLAIDREILVTDVENEAKTTADFINMIYSDNGTDTELCEQFYVSGEENSRILCSKIARLDSQAEKMAHELKTMVINDAEDFTSTSTQEQRTDILFASHFMMILQNNLNDDGNKWYKPRQRAKTLEKFEERKQFLSKYKPFKDMQREVASGG